MAQTGYTPILIYSSSTAAASPAAGNLTNSTLGSELAINITDGKLFYKDNANAIQVIGWKTVPTTAGGTGLTTYTAGDLLYYASGTTLTKLGIGAANTVLTSSGSAPQWVTSLTGLTGVSSSSITNTSLTSGRIVYSTTGGAQTDSANLVFNGSNFGLGNSSPSSNVLATLQFNSGTINAAMLSIGYGATPSFNFRNAGGTAASPSATTLSPMSLIGGTTSDGTNFFNTISITGIIESTPTTGSHPTGITFSTTPSGSTSRLERARIFSSGGVSIGNTTDPGVGALNVTNNGWFGTNADLLASNRRMSVSGTCGASFRSTGGSGFVTLDVWNNATSGDNTFQIFFTETSATSRGSITYNRAGGLVAYNVTSDYRAKTIHGDLTNSGEIIDALKVYEGTMNGASIARPMMLAHEAQAVAPYSVTGKKDELNEDGTPKYQQMDHASYVPLLIAELQSLRKRVAELENKQ